LSIVAASFGQDIVRPVIGTSNNQFRVVNTYPEYWVDGKPFIVYSGSFLYHRIPRDRWAEELIHQMDMGINTVELLPMWAWHEPEEGMLDFDGHTNPRRDLQYLLRLIDLLGLKLSLRPGPYLTGEWRNGGYPDWLLRRPEYQMSEQAILEGRYPRWSALQYEKSDEAAAEWLKNETHLRYTQEWFRDVLGLVKPLLAENGGPLLSIQMDDDQACGLENYNGPNFWRYMDRLRQFAKEATNNSPIPYYVDGADMRLNAEANDATPEPFWNTGQDYVGEDSQLDLGGYSTPMEAAKNKFLTEILKTQPLFIPGHIEFQTSWFPDWNDTFTIYSHPSNQLMATSVMFQNGLKMMSFYPPLDTLYPAGFETPWTNHFYVWDVAVNYAGKETERAVYTRRLGRLLNGMGPFLGSAHFLPDAGLIYPMATYPQAPMTPEEANYIAAFAQRVLWSGAFDHYNFELIDSDHTPAENFRRYRVLMLFNPASSKEDLKIYPHLEHYSEKAQRMVRDYVEAGGTLVVFPTVPRGAIFDQLLSPLGEPRRVAGNAPLTFTDGTRTMALNAHTVLRLPEHSGVQARVFAKDSRGGVVGVRYAHGKGQVMFLGTDFSRWCVPAGAGRPAQARPKTAPLDCPEEAQSAARLALPALMKGAGVERKVYSVAIPGKARDLSLYVSELIADAGSRPFDKRAGDVPGFGFVGVTNFSVDRARKADIYLTDPHLTDLAAHGPERYLHLPPFTLPPRQSVLLPIHIPLNSSFWEIAPGLEAGEEVAFATAELRNVSYDGLTLRLEFTSPADAEVGLHLKSRPQEAKVDGVTTTILEDPTQNIYSVRIPKGEAPHFVRTVELAYPRPGPRITIVPQEPWIAGEARVVHVSVENSRPATLEGTLDFTAGRIYKNGNPPLSISVPSQSSRQFSFPVEIPADVPENQIVKLKASFRPKDSTALWAWDAQVRVHRPFDCDFSPVVRFPLREDQSFPIVHPLLVNLNLPGGATIHVRVRNGLNVQQVVQVASEGSDLNFTPSSSHLVLPANGEAAAEIHVVPARGTGAYPFRIVLQSGSYNVKEDGILAAVKGGEALAYTLDYDRDGFEDVILENSQVRLFVSPHAGGRAFGYVLKDSESNAFDSVGGMRDTFTTRFEPEDMKWLPDWTRANWQGLYNRPYSFQVINAAGAQAEVRLEYTAPDIYPKGIKLERSLKLSGNQNVVIEETRLTPFGIDKPQSYVLETSVPFKVSSQPNYKDWFVPGRGAQEFVPSKVVALPPSVSHVGTSHKKGGQTFAVISLTAPEHSELVVEQHSALIRFIFPSFSKENEPKTYRAAYYLDENGAPKEIETIAADLKAEKKN
jgi:hypothetical protein